MKPQDLKYAETHEWLKSSGKKDAVVGLTDYALSQLSDLVHIDLPKVGDKVEQGTPFGEIESVKTVADLVSPVTGKIVQINTDIVDNLDTLAEDPYEEGWLVKIRLDDKSEVDQLMSAKDYEDFLKTAKKEEEDEEADDEDFV